MRTVTPIEFQKGKEKVIFEEVPKDEPCRCGHLRSAHKSTTISAGNPINYRDSRDLWEKRCANHRCTLCDCDYFCLPIPKKAEDEKGCPVSENTKLTNGPVGTIVSEKVVE